MYSKNSYSYSYSYSISYVKVILYYIFLINSKKWNNQIIYFKYYGKNSSIICIPPIQ